MYAGKYRAFVGEPKNPTNLDLVEIHRDGPQRQSRSEVLNLLSKASSIYVWENSSIASEAVLLGTVCIFVPSPFLGDLIADYELGTDGISISLEQNEIIKARGSLPNARLKYLEAQKEFKNQLNMIIEQHENWSMNLPVQSSMKIPVISYTINRHRIRLFFSMLKHIGIRKTFKVVKEFGYLKRK